MSNNESANDVKQLSDKIFELEQLVDEMVKEKNSTELLEFPWVGNLGQWYWSFPSNKVYFNDKKVLNLGFSEEEIPSEIGFEFFTQKLHVDDYERVMQNMKDHLEGRSDSYEVEYRIKAKDGSYKWYYDRGKITKRDENGNPVLLAGIVFDISKNKQIETELKITNQKLNDLLIHDDLTNLYNRRYLFTELDNIIKIKKLDFSMILFDIDHFKLVNDKYGHLAGDKVLVEFSKTAKRSIGEAGSLFRWGGEEFICILPNTKLKEAISVAEKIRTNIEECPLGLCGQVTASFGIASYHEEDSVQSIISKADSLMFKAKEAGRNCIKF